MRGRQQEGFVGRGGELAQFAANLTLPVNDPARRFVFSVHGDGGVGKSTLLNELRQIAIGRSALCAGVDEHLFGLPETMNGLACDLQAQKAKLPNFSKLYSTYLRRLTEAQSDPGAPDGLAHFVTRTAVRAGLNAAQAVPVAGLAAAAVDSEEAAQQADRLRAFLGSKFRKHEDVRMLMSPADVLTPALTRDLASVGGARALVLFFDTYEQTGPVVDPWLRSMLEGRFGSLPANLVIVIAGREPLDQASWASFLTVVAEAPLMPFTEIEARQLLAAEGVTGEHKVAEILSASGRLPLLVAMLAQSVREKGGGSTDPSDDAVGRFLAGEADPVRRGIALTAAVPRTVNEDILSLLIGPSPADQAGGLYEWLRSRTFVTHQGGRCQYHDVVRSMMLRQLRGQSPQRWQTAHERLAGHYRAVRTSTSTSDEDSWGNPDWEQAAAEETYHRLCADSHRVLPDALDQVIQACAHNSAAASRWARMIRTAGQDAEAPPVAALGRQLEDSLVSDDGDGVIACLGIIVDAANLRPSSLAAALRTRGRAL